MSISNLVWHNFIGEDALFPSKVLLYFETSPSALIFSWRKISLAFSVDRLSHEPYNLRHLHFNLYCSALSFQRLASKERNCLTFMRIDCGAAMELIKSSLPPEKEQSGAQRYHGQSSDTSRRSPRSADPPSNTVRA